MNVIQNNPFYSLSLSEARKHLWHLDSVSESIDERKLIHAQFERYYSSLGGTKMYKKGDHHKDDITDLPF